jgi:mannose-6-phosphate isomerase-like protein (cupin superfamily)
MDQLKKGLEISLRPEQAKPYLEAFHKQITEWDMALPSVEPLVLDFGLDDFLRYGLIEYWIANEINAGYGGKYLFVFDGQTCPTHKHTNKVETYYIIKGRIGVHYGDEHFMMQAGDTLRIDPGTFHRFTAFDGPAMILELSQPCIVDDNIFQDDRIPMGRTSET